MIIASLGLSELSVMQRYLERFDCSNFIKHRMTEMVLNLYPRVVVHIKKVPPKTRLYRRRWKFLNDRVERCYIHFLNTRILSKTVQSNIHVKAQSKLLVFSILQEPQKMTFILWNQFHGLLLLALSIYLLHGSIFHLNKDHFYKVEIVSEKHVLE